jgi:hypothetical protein
MRSVRLPIDHPDGESMRRARLASIALVAVVLALLAAPAGVLAADPVAVTGTVVRDGAPVTGVDVVVSVSGSDLIAAATTDENGAFSVDVEAEIGAGIQVFATGQTSRSEPDAKGCVTTETPTGSITATIDALPPAPLTVTLDQVLTGEVCTATAKPVITPPPTDSGAGRPGQAPGNGGLIVLGMLAAAAAGSLALVRRRA